MMHTPTRGFTLLTAIILASVILALALALLDVTYKQVILSSSAKQSQYAFYAADSALECVLYYDQQYDAFGTNPFGLSSISCNGTSISFSSSGSAPRTTALTIPCAGISGSEQAYVQIFKNYPGTPSNRLYANGYSSCNTSDARRIERGLRVTY